MLQDSHLLAGSSNFVSGEASRAPDLRAFQLQPSPYAPGDEQPSPCSSANSSAAPFPAPSKKSNILIVRVSFCREICKTGQASKSASEKTLAPVETESPVEEPVSFVLARHVALACQAAGLGLRTYLASTIFPCSLDIAVAKCYVTISSCGAYGVVPDGRADNGMVCGWCCLPCNFS